MWGQAESTKEIDRRERKDGETGEEKVWERQGEDGE